MNITEKTGKWRITTGQIENRQTGQIRPVCNIPSANTLATMRYTKFMRCCEEAFATGDWPK